MDKLPFADKYGRMIYCDDAEAFVREKGYVIVKRGGEVLCNYDAATGLFFLPSDNEIEIKAAPTLTFTALSYLYENNHPIRETQHYRLYDVKGVDMQSAPLQWCKLSDISLKRIMFDSTQLIGIKNILVRLNDHEKNL